MTTQQTASSAAVIEVFLAAIVLNKSASYGLRRQLGNSKK